MGPLVTVKGGVACIATPIFQTCHASGQPIHRRLVEALVRRFLHLCYGAPTVRGRGARGEDGNYRVMEMIEDIPTLGPVSARARLPPTPRPGA
jgi:hypothetical protein